jgi:hypothetical protein
MVGLVGARLGCLERVDGTLSAVLAAQARNDLITSPCVVEQCKGECLVECMGIGHGSLDIRMPGACPEAAGADHFMAGSFQGAAAETGDNHGSYIFR